MAVGIGGVLVVGAMFLGGLFKGIGFGPGGSGDGDGEGDGKPGTHAEAPDKPAVQVPQPKPTETAATGTGLGDVVNVLIDGDQYKILRSSDAPWYDKANYEPATLERVVELAGQVEGDSGVKIRIAMRGNADSQAEERLERALLDAGLDPTAVNWRDQTVP
jgi:hypothetical protein